MSFRNTVLGALLAVATLTFTAPAGAQIPDEFTNLEVLPKDIGKRELVSVMREFAGALGVRCNHCHVGESTTSLEGYDFATDEKEAKRVARTMMKMTSDINGTYLAGLEREGVTAVRCVTCHHGVTEPETIDRIVLATIESDGLDAALVRYRDLRGEYYGRASYDFSAGPLNTVGENLARQQNNVEGAIVVMKMNLEFNPDAPHSHLFLGQLYEQAGNKEAAIASVEKSLELEPDNEWAKKILERIKASE